MAFVSQEHDPMQRFLAIAQIRNRRRASPFESPTRVISGNIVAALCGGF
jgi:hypothetical protein